MYELVNTVQHDERAAQFGNVLKPIHALLETALWAGVALPDKIVPQCKTVRL
jgi:hypothetical protein